MDNPLQKAWKNFKSVMTDDLEKDMAKAVSGNKAAGIRVRKAMQELKNHAQTVRKAVLEVKGE